MNAAEAHRIVAEMGLTDHCRDIASNAPPIPHEALEVWRRAVKASCQRRVDDLEQPAE